MQKYKLKEILLFSVLLLCLAITVSAGRDVYLGGFPFGVRMTTDGVFVSGIGDIDSKVGRVCPAADAGIAEGDVITSINGEPTESAEKVSDIIAESGGKRLTVGIKRNGKALTVNIIPVQTVDGKSYKTGMYIKDSASGIGTVTYVEENQQGFGGLGHGITDRATLQLLPLRSGSIHDVKITDVTKGCKEMPGELKGTLDVRRAGKLLMNTEAGVFGRLDRKLTGLTKIEVAEPGEIKKGKCTIHTCLEGITPTELRGEITEIVDKKSKTKNFIVTLTDDDCLEKTGGIVQGMSGSPIVQNGKLVGAVTHVLMKDQASGYGIFIENMLNAAEMPMAKAS